MGKLFDDYNFVPTTSTYVPIPSHEKEVTTAQNNYLANTKEADDEMGLVKNFQPNKGVDTEIYNNYKTDAIKSLEELHDKYNGKQYDNNYKRDLAIWTENNLKNPLMQKLDAGKKAKEAYLKEYKPDEHYNDISEFDKGSVYYDPESSTWQDTPFAHISPEKKVNIETAAKPYVDGLNNFIRENTSELYKESIATGIDAAGNPTSNLYGRSTKYTKGVTAQYNAMKEGYFKDYLQTAEGQRQLKREPIESIREQFEGLINPPDIINKTQITKDGGTKGGSSKEPTQDSYGVSPAKNDTFSEPHNTGNHNIEIFNSGVSDFGAPKQPAEGINKDIFAKDGYLVRDNSDGTSWRIAKNIGSAIATAGLYNPGFNEEDNSQAGLVNEKQVLKNAKLENYQIVYTMGHGDDRHLVFHGDKNRMEGFSERPNIGIVEENPNGGFNIRAEKEDPNTGQRNNYGSFKNENMPSDVEDRPEIGDLAVLDKHGVPHKVNKQGVAKWTGTLAGDKTEGSAIHYKPVTQEENALYLNDGTNNDYSGTTDIRNSHVGIPEQPQSHNLMDVNPNSSPLAEHYNNVINTTKQQMAVINNKISSQDAKDKAQSIINKNMSEISEMETLYKGGAAANKNLARKYLINLKSGLLGARFQKMREANKNKQEKSSAL